MHTEIIKTPNCTEAQLSIYAWLVSKVRRTFNSYKAWSKLRNQRRLDREAFKHLLVLDDRILRDVGLTRADIIQANSLPLSQNAAQELENVSKMNRRRR